MEAPPPVAPSPRPSPAMEAPSPKLDAEIAPPSSANAPFYSPTPSSLDESFASSSVPRIVFGAKRPRVKGASTDSPPQPSSLGKRSTSGPFQPDHNKKVVVAIEGLDFFDEGVDKRAVPVTSKAVQPKRGKSKYVDASKLRAWRAGLFQHVKELNEKNKMAKEVQEKETTQVEMTQAAKEFMLDEVKLRGLYNQDDDN
jgi:hypothetical protein